MPAHERPVIFIGPYEHHSNEVMWRECVADVVVIPQDLDGHIDLGVLRDRLQEFAARPLLIGSFSAASNVTGIVTDTDAVSRLLHEHGALAFWDFAAAGPYVDIQMYGAGGPGRRPTRRPTRTPSSSARTSSSAAPAPPAFSSSGAST